jgi:succinoglycan biosynthesis protein ExoA
VNDFPPAPAVVIAVPSEAPEPQAFQHVLVVIPCLDEAANLPRLLAQFRNEAPGALIVVADGGSRDGSQAVVATQAETCRSIRLMDNPARIQSAGVNAAVTAFGEGRRWLLRVDAHCTYPSGFVGTLLAAAEQHAADNVVVPMVTNGTGCFQRAVAAAQNSVLGTGGSAHRHVRAGKYVDHGHHALMAIEGFRQVGGYDASFSHNEDAELDHRFGLAGARTWLEPAAAVGYAPRTTPLALFRQYRNYGRGRARTVAKHRMKLRFRQLAPFLVLPAILVAMAAAVFSSVYPPLLLLTLPMLSWVLLTLGYGALLGLRQRSTCAAAAGVAAMTMHFAWSLGFWQMMLKGRLLECRELNQKIPWFCKF